MSDIMWRSCADSYSHLSSRIRLPRIISLRTHSGRLSMSIPVSLLLSSSHLMNAMTLYSDYKAKW